MSSIPTLAHARREDLVVQELPDEVLVYDLKTQQAHCLNQTAAYVWNHCDGKKQPQEIAVLMEKELRKPVGEDAVWIALKQLNQANLLQAPPVFPAGLSRRAAMRRIGLAAAVALPLVTTVISPTAAMAASVGPVICIINACQDKGSTAASCGACATSGYVGRCYNNNGCGNGGLLASGVSCTVCFSSSGGNSWVCSNCPP